MARFKGIKMKKAIILKKNLKIMAAKFRNMAKQRKIKLKRP